MGNVSSKLLGIFVQKRVEGLSKSTVGPRFLSQVMVPLPFVYFCHQSF